MTGPSHRFAPVALVCGVALIPLVSAAPTSAAAPDLTVRLTDAPKPYSNRSASFSWTASASLASATCALDGRKPVGCSDSMSYDKLSNGSHTFVLQVAGSSGDTAQATYRWTVGDAPPGPAIALTGEPAPSTSHRSARFDWKTTGNLSSTTCSLDGAAAKGCSSPYGLDSLASGPHSFTVKVANGSGDSASARWSWTVNGGPAVRITSGPSGTTSATTATFEFATTGDVRREFCVLDGGHGRHCASPVRYQGLAAGGHTFEVTVADAHGASASTSRSWTVQPSPPPGNARYVSASEGSDANDGSSARPWKTLQKAADNARPGMTVVIHGGTYAGFVLRTSGTPSQPITFTAASGENPTIDGNASPQKESPVDLESVQWVVLSDLTVTGAHTVYEAGIKAVSSSHLQVLDSTITQNDSYGIRLYHSTDALISGNAISHAGAGVELHYEGQNVHISNNRIFDNDRMVVSDPTPNNDNGGNAIQLFKTTGPVTVDGNVMYGNRAVSHDYGMDGGQVEIYGASNTLIEDNVMWDAEVITETGTDSGVQCSNNEMVHNVAYGGAGHPYGHALGIYMRCGLNMLIANNTFDDLDYWQLVIELSSGFSASVDGFTMVNNVMSQDGDKVYAIGSNLPESIRIDNNLTWEYRKGAGVYASVAGEGNATSIGQFRQWTSFDAQSIYADPLYVDRVGFDFHLAGGSPGIDSGMPIAGVTTGYSGRAPDIGRYESGVN